MKKSTTTRRTRAVVVTGAAIGSLTAALAFAPSASATSVHVHRDHGVLAVFGGPRSDTITVSRDVAGAIEINGRPAHVHGVPATVTNVDRIAVFGRRGNDRITFDETNGPLPNAILDGGRGDDVLLGGSGKDQLFGDSGNDSLSGGAGDDALYGGSGTDLLTGGVGTDQSFGNAGDDQLVWNPGDGSDLNQGGDGTDAVEVNGGGVGETFTATANGTRVRFDRVDPLPFSLDIGTSERLVVNGNGGDDSFSASGDLASLIALTVDGGDGNDRIAGGNGNDTLIGGAGDDGIDGNAGADSVSLGDGNDTFVWDAGDGSDVVEGEAGQDTLVFNGSAAAEQMTLSANGSRARLVRDLGNITMDLNGIERVDTNALGGADTVTVNDLSGTDVTEADVNLAGAPGSSAGDSAGDSVVLNATDGVDDATITGTQQDGVTVAGLHALVRVLGSDGVADSLAFNAGAGDDTVDATGLAAGVVALTVNGGAGTDVLSGGPGTVLVQ